jgi:hypothetical protein
VPPDPYPIIDLTARDVLAPEEMGSKRKGWVQVGDDHAAWLFKYPRVSAGALTGEHWAEKVAAEIAAVLDLPHARAEIARIDGDWGVICRKFDRLLVPGAELIHGNDLLAGAVLGYERDKSFRQSDHTLDNIFQAIAHLFPEEPVREAAWRQLAGYIVLDALILNTDRHHENWAVIRFTQFDGTVVHEIAPTFDHASSLARNERPEKLAMWLKDPNQVARYARRGRGGIYLDSSDEHGANPLRLAEVLARRWPEYFRPVAQRLENAGIAPILATLDRLPEAVISQPQREFAQRLLAWTFGRLLSTLR